jgi:hypothetical protein
MLELCDLCSAGFKLEGVKLYAARCCNLFLSTHFVNLDVSLKC